MHTVCHLKEQLEESTGTSQALIDLYRDVEQTRPLNDETVLQTVSDVWWAEIDSKS